MVIKNNTKKKYIVIPIVVTAALLLVNLITVNNQVQASENLMNGVKVQKVNSEKPVDENFILSNSDFSIKLFKNTAKKGNNFLVSPFSVGMALGMTENGAENNTLNQLENVIGGSLYAEDINRNYNRLSNRLGKTKDGSLRITEDGNYENIKGGKFKTANSIWFRDKIVKVNKDFLNRNASFYNADIFKLNFDSLKTVNKINNYVKEKTDWKINNIIKRIDKRDMMFLINTLYFEDGWLDEYKQSDIKENDFHAEDKDVNVEFMSSFERYIHDEKADGIIKPFKDSDFAFAAVLPKDNNLESYINQMTGKRFLNLLNSETNEKARCLLPKFKYEYEAKLKEPLKKMGIEDAFDESRADFSKLGNISNGNLYISDILHKTFIQIDETGAKAGAATKVTIDGTSAPLENQKKLIFNRPFVYAIYDTKTKLPIFIGTVYNPLK